MRRLVMGLPVFLILSLTALAQSYTITTYAGPPLPATGMMATVPSLDSPYCVISDGAGGFYVASVGLSAVYRVGSNGMLTVVAGTGTPGYSGDGGPAASAQLNSP